MTERFGFFVTFLLSATVVQLKVYKPCDLAQELNKMRNADVTQNLNTLVCVAGFHAFDTTSIHDTPDRVRRYGIFGLPLDRDGYRKSLLGNVGEEAQTFVYNALYVGGKPNPLASRFYSRICNNHDGEQVRVVRCHLDDYLIGGVVFDVPTRSSVFYSNFQSPNITSCVPDRLPCF